MTGSRITATISGVVAAGTSVICMASMGAMAAASTAGALTGMAGMGAATASISQLPAVTRALQAIGLGGLTHLPNAVLQPLLMVLLLVAIGAALWRVHRARTARASALALVIVAAAAGLYTSIYIAIAETGYWTALVVLAGASILSAWSGRRGRVPSRP